MTGPPAGRADRPRWPTFVALGLIAGAITLFEIVLTRIFSFTIWHHFTFMVISVALLGFAASGVVLQLRPQIGTPASARAAWSAVLFGVTAVLAVALVTRVPFDPTRLAEMPVQLAYLAVYYVALVVPFTFAGLTIVALLNGFPGAVNRLYASDLAGAGLGCLLFVGAMGRVGAEGVLVLVAAVAATGAWLLRFERTAGRSRPALAWLTVAVLFAAAVPWAQQLLEIQPGPGKGLRGWLDTKQFPHARLAFTQWNALSRVDVVENTGTVRWTRNSDATAVSPPQTQIVIDGDAATPIIKSNGDLQSLGFLDYTLSSAALQAFRPGHVLVIGAGGGLDILTGLYHGAAHVDAVEINPMIVDLATRRYADWSGGLFARKDVTLHVGEGRSFVRQQTGRYDLIQLSLIDTWAASASGAYSLAEGYLYTTEAFQDYVEHLSDDGVLTITRWLWDPPRETLKLCTVAAAALRQLGMTHPEDHVVVLGLHSLGSVLIKRSPFTRADLQALARVVRTRHFGFLYAPGISGDNAYIRFFTSPEPKGFLASYPYDVLPATDDSPFFFQFGRWRDANLLGTGWRENPIGLSGRLVLLTTLVQALALALALLVVPLLFGRRRLGQRRRARGALLYFFSIGLSFMLLEITLMQRFTLFLGHPVYALTLVLAVLLVSAGAGSICAPKICTATRGPRFVFVAIVGVVLAYAFGLPMAFHAALGCGLATRLMIGLLLLFPLGFLLGVPFPVAVASLADEHAMPLLGWAWAANGCASVLGPILAVLLAMDLGFSIVMVVAAAGYAAAGASFGSWAASGSG